MTELERLGVFQLYTTKNKFEKKYGWQYAIMNMIFGVKQKDLLHNSRLVGGGNIVDFTEHTKYSYTIKYLSVRLMILIDLKNGLGLVAGDIGNALCRAPCAENIWSCYGAEFGPRCGAAVVLKWDLYVLKTESNSFHKYYGDFLRDLGFTPSRADQDLWILKSNDY